MKRLISLLLVLVCLLSLAACDTDPTESAPAGNGGSSNGSSSNGSSNNGGDQGNVPEDGVKPGDDLVNDDGSLEVPAPEKDKVCTVDAATWQSLLAEDVLRAAMKENSLTMLTTDGNTEQYQMFYCAGGRFGCLQIGNYRSETVCAVEDGTVYIYNKTGDEGWSRTTSSQSYDEYVASRYFNGAMQYLPGVAGVYAQARYEETEKSYIVENYAISEGMTGTLKVQFADGKISSIKLFLSANGQSGCLSTVFGSVAVPEIPTEYKDGNSTSNSQGSQNQGDKLPAEAVCSEAAWKRLFGEQRVLDSLMDSHASIKIDNNQLEYLYQLGMDRSRFTLSGDGQYEEVLFGHDEYFLRESKDGQWLRYSGHREQEAVLNEKAAVLTQLLIPLSTLYSQAHFDGFRSFTLTDVSFEHGTFGNVTADYTIIVQGGMLEEMQATIRTSAGDWALNMNRDKPQEITFPQEFVDMSEGGKRPGK